MAVLPLIEEEVLLVLPLAPRHESCEPPVALNKGCCRRSLQFWRD